MKVLSIIVPAYNMQDYIGQCLDGMVACLNDKLEIVVVNDGSTDATSDIAHNYEKNYPEIVRVIDKENGHYGSAVNAGLLVVSGFYVKVVDADDSVDTNGLLALISMLAEDLQRGALVYDLVINDSAIIDINGQNKGLIRHDFIPYEVVDVSSLTFVQVQKMRVGLHSISYRTAMLVEMGYRQSEGIPYTDTEWETLPMRRVNRLKYCPHLVVRYLIGRSGQTMEPQTFAHDFPFVMNMAVKMMQRYLLDDITPFYKYRFASIMGDVYYTHLVSPIILKWPTPQGNLIDFDEKLSLIDDIYTLTNQLTVSKRLGFHYIREWRRHKSSATLKFALWRIYVRIAKLILRICG